MIGEGSFSCVFLARDASGAPASSRFREYAIKVCEKVKIVKESKLEYIHREKDILATITKHWKPQGAVLRGVAFHLPRQPELLLCHDVCQKWRSPQIYRQNGREGHRLRSVLRGRTFVSRSILTLPRWRHSPRLEAGKHPVKRPNAHFDHGLRLGQVPQGQIQRQQQPEQQPPHHPGQRPTRAPTPTSRRPRPALRRPRRRKTTRTSCRRGPTSDAVSSARRNTFPRKSYAPGDPLELQTCGPSAASFTRWSRDCRRSSLRASGWSSRR